MIKKYIKVGIIGITIGCLYSAFYALILGLSKPEITMNMIDYSKSLFASMVVGFVYASSSMLFTDERLSLLKATIMHFLLISITFFLMAFIAGWIPYTVDAYLIGFGTFFAIYVVIWFIIYFIQYRKLKKMNNNLKKI